MTGYLEGCITRKPALLLIIIIISLWKVLSTVKRGNSNMVQKYLFIRLMTNSVADPDLWQMDPNPEGNKFWLEF